MFSIWPPFSTIDYKKKGDLLLAVSIIYVPTYIYIDKWKMDPTSYVALIL